MFPNFEPDTLCKLRQFSLLPRPDSFPLCTFPSHFVPAQSTNPARTFCSLRWVSHLTPRGECFQHHLMRLCIKTWQRAGQDDKGGGELPAARQERQTAPVTPSPLDTSRTGWEGNQAAVLGLQQPWGSVFTSQPTGAVLTSHSCSPCACPTSQHFPTAL